MADAVQAFIQEPGIALRVQCNVKDLLPPHHHLSLKSAAALFLLSVGGVTVSVGCVSLPDYLKKGGDRRTRV